MTLLQQIFDETVRALYLAAPFLLFGLLVAGLMHVLVPQALIVRWMGRPGLSGVAWAAAVGVPLPVCSCGVVPITVELRRKGAGQPASLSFLVTTPESSIDSILLTWGLMGPVMAIARPLAAFATAMFGGSLAIAFLDEGSDLPEGSPDDEPGGCCDAEAGGCGKREDRCGEASLVEGSDRALRALRRSLGLGDSTAGGAGDEPPPRLWGDLFRPALRYGFVELLDDLAFWLVLGLGVAGLLAALLPSDLAGLGLGAGLLPMILVLAVAVPLYMCASASTPIAAALMAKGVSPGAALVFLLAGPATNVATVVLLARTFGRRFVQIYLVAVVVGALAAGLALDALVGWLVLDGGQSLAVEHELIPPLFGWACLAVTVGLLGWRLGTGALRQGLGELRQGLSLRRPDASAP